MLEGCGADDQDALDAEVAGHDPGCGDGLDGLAEAHLVGDEAPAGAGGEERAFALVVVEVGFHEPIEFAAADAAGESLVDDLAAAGAVAMIGDEGEHVIAAAEIGIDGSGASEEVLESVSAGDLEETAVIELPGDQASKLRRRRFGEAQSHAALGTVLEEQLALLGLVAIAKDLPRAAGAIEPAEDELDVLAGAEGVGGKVGAGAEILGGGVAADDDAIGAFGFGIGDIKVGKDGVVAGVVQNECLLAPNWRRRAACHSSRDISAGLCVREIFFVAATDMMRPP